MASNGDSGSVNRNSLIYDDVLSEEKPEGREISSSKDNNKNDCENEHGSLIEDKKESSEQVSATNISSYVDMKTKTESAELAASEGTVTLNQNNFAESETRNKGVTTSLNKGPVHDEKNCKVGNDGFGIPRKESDGDKRRTQKDCEKELWMLRKTDPSKDDSIKKDDASQPVGDSLKGDSPESQPTKPPRRNPHKKQNTGNKETGSEDAQISTNEGDPIKPPRRHLPQIPKDPTTAKAESFKKPSLGEVLSDSYDAISPIKNDSLTSENPQRDIICNPVLTSSPNQGEITSLSIESFGALDASHRVLSFIDVSSGGTIQKVESFYDYLYSAGRSEEVQSVLPVPQAGDRIGSALTDSEEHLYDSVPLEEGHSIGLDKKSHLMPYDEVMVNQEAYVMPSNDEDSDGFSDISDPWGSDFEAEGDITDGGSLRTQDGGVDDEDPYDSVEISPMAERKRPFKFVSELTSFSPFSGMKKTPLGLKGQLRGCLGMSKAPSLPYLASDKRVFEEAAYVEPDITDSVNYQQAVMPPMPAGLSTEQIKRHQIVKFMLESEADYMRLLDLLIKQYELPIRERDLLEPNKIDTIFQHVHRVLQCHVMFNIELSDRMKDWTPQDKIGDVLYALFCKSMVLDAYSGYVNNFTRAMDMVKVACRTHLAFAQFLKARRQASREGHSLHHLMLKPIQRFPQILALLQELLLVTPRDHPDRCPVQLALTQLECLAENLKERKRESELRNKVKSLDALVAQSHKPLASGNRYFIRQDDFVQCVVEGESILGTKKRRIIMLSDMLLCVSLIKGKKDRAMHMITDSKAKYKLKWNVPLNDVDIVEYGPGVDVFTTFNKTTISHSKEGQYRKTYSGCHEHFEDLQQDLAIIGQIAGLVGTLRRSYQLLDLAKVQQWHRAVQRTIEEETKLANLYWLELSLPSRNDRVNYIFSTDSPTVKAEWVTAINSCKLRLAPENNPGWYLPEDDGTGGVAVQRRNMPLLKDNTNIFMMNQKAQVQGIVSCPDTSEPLPGVHDNYNNLWLLCSNGGNTGHVTVVSVSLSSLPRVVESFHVCESNILCGEYVEQTCVLQQKIKSSFTGRFGFPFPTVWLGTQDGRIFIYNAVDSTRRYVMSVKLPDAVLDIKTVSGKTYAGIANGSVVVFKRNKADGVWNFSELKAISLGKMPVIAIAIVGETLWCSSGNKIFIVNHDEEVVKQAIEIDENPKRTIKHVVSYGVGVWVSLWKLPTIKLFHSETLQHVQDISIASPVTNMQRDIDSQLEKTKLDKVYVTALLADEGLLWVGTSVGVTLVYPLPRLEGVPLVSGKACVAFHSYGDRLRCLYPLKNNPDRSAAGNRTLEDKPEFKLFRDHEVRDASVQTDPGISGTWSYAARGPALAENNRASPKEGGTPNKISALRSIPTLGGGDQEEFSDEDVHSDDEFDFIEDGQTASTVPPSRSATATTSSTGSFSVRFQPVEDPFKSIPSSVRSDDFVGKTDFRVDDFARMLSEFEGFGTSTPSTLPEAPRIPIIVTDEPSTIVTSDYGERNEDGSVSSGQEGSNESVTHEKATGMVLEQGTAKGSTASGNATQTGSEDDFRSRVKSVGEYVKLTEARAAAEAQGLTLDQSKGSEFKQETTPRQEVKPKQETQSGVQNQLSVTSTTSASYVEVLDESDPKVFKSPETAVKTPEVVYDIPRQDDSYSVFERSERRESDTSGIATIRKVENLKPRLPFPVLMVSAGEGYADLRRKRRDENDKESRIMIWQIS